MSVVFRLAVLVFAAVLLVVASHAPGAQADTVNVQVGDNWFCDSSFQNGVCPTTVAVGDTVVWNFDGTFNPHSSTHCGADCDNPTASPIWDSGVTGSGTFSHTFNDPGTFLYYCTVHPFTMRGEITVEAPPVGGVAELPEVDEAPAESTEPASGWPLWAVVVGGGAAVIATALTGGPWYARRRRAG